MLFRYGNFSHDDGQINLTRMDIRYKRSPRGKRISRINTLHLQGEICQTTQALITSKIEELISVYSNDYQNCGLYQDDGTVTPHALTNDSPDCLSGVRVVERSWPKGGPAEYATARTFHITLEAEYLDVEDNLVDWQETLEFRGNTGPRVVVEETYFGPRSYVAALKTSQKIIQSGRAIGMSGYVMPPGALFPQFEHVDQRYVRLGSGINQGRQAAYFSTFFTYYMTALSYTEGAPRTL